jgi:hypothetical protein
MVYSVLKRFFDHESESRKKRKRKRLMHETGFTEKLVVATLINEYTDESFSLNNENGTCVHKVTDFTCERDS